MIFSYIPPEEREEKTDMERSGLPPTELQTYRTMRSLGTARHEDKYYNREDRWD